ncbi:MAG: LLM class flavin-dependent oxidoreductase [Rhizorhabdus sp.]|uniref:LLM class flavin-dependent oxidoreductase n=1 Tax=Rhizorhabdus sp. TaxID=1968843 RepID=UPI001B7A1529|nr:LLM class flavin-dependent oxidoreductase [Rhizorhabdus sp.]MBP8231586.1 LLM class flavin-dependent oxidoreductase [Rhizorhabdus sp.]
MDKKMILGMGLTSGYGNHPGAWRAPGVDPANYAKVEANIRYAQTAERGGFAFLFTTDFPALRGDLEYAPILNIMEPMLQLAAISQATSRIGLVATGSTSFQEPFNTARQFKALDVMSHGRAGWNAVTTSDPAVAANYGMPVGERNARYQRAHETVQVVQALWGSWEPDAWVADGHGALHRSCQAATHQPAG